MKDKTKERGREMHIFKNIVEPGNAGLVVKGWNPQLKAPEFKSQHQILNEYFST